jgi:hypothetical protein
MGCLLLLLLLMMMIFFFPNFISLTCSSCGHVPIFKSFVCVCFTLLGVELLKSYSGV